MTNQFKIRWLWCEIAERIGLSETEGLELVRRALIAGEIRCDARNTTYIAQNVSQFDRSAKYGSNLNINVAPDLWSTLQIDLEGQNPYFHFYDQYGVYLSTDVYIDAKEAYKFIGSRDPLRQDPLPSKIAMPNSVIPRKGVGGAPSKINWERCIIEAAKWMYDSKAPDSQADLIRYIAELLGDEAPSETQLKAHLAPLYRAFRAIDQER